MLGSLVAHCPRPRQLTSGHPLLLRALRPLSLALVALRPLLVRVVLRCSLLLHLHSCAQGRCASMAAMMAHLLLCGGKMAPKNPLPKIYTCTYIHHIHALTQMTTSGWRPLPTCPPQALRLRLVLRQPLHLQLPLTSRTLRQMRLATSSEPWAPTAGTTRQEHVAHGAQRVQRRRVACRVAPATSHEAQGVRPLVIRRASELLPCRVDSQHAHGPVPVLLIAPA